MDGKFAAAGHEGQREEQREMGMRHRRLIEGRYKTMGVDDSDILNQYRNKQVDYFFMSS